MGALHGLCTVCTVRACGCRHGIAQRCAELPEVLVPPGAAVVRRMCALEPGCYWVMRQCLRKQIDDAVGCNAKILLLPSTGVGAAEREVPWKNEMRTAPGIKTGTVQHTLSRAGGVQEHQCGSCTRVGGLEPTDVHVNRFCKSISVVAEVDPVRSPLPAALNCAIATSQDGQPTVLTLRRVRLECSGQSVLLEESLS
eukprot:Skav234220  [mRNA]  locus=scaffold1464:26621:30621:- [translate_table: standard]